MRVLLTGASGFVGRALARRFASQAGWQTRLALRAESSDGPAQVERVVVGDLSGSRLQMATKACDVVVHAAARVHVMDERSRTALQDYRRVNVEGSLELAQQAARNGARRFVFISTVKIHGEETAPGTAFHADDLAAPEDHYGKSKSEAESALRQLSGATGMELVIVRPPLVYGPGVKANFGALLRATARGTPLPFGAIDNRRSLVALDNLVDLLTLCVDHPAAANQAFLVSDGEDLSSADLVRRLARALGRRPHLVPIPVAWLQAAAGLMGRGTAARRLCANLQVDIGKTRSLLQWAPPIDVDEGLRRTVATMVAS